jgi:hypothetical protein
MWARDRGPKPISALRAPLGNDLCRSLDMGFVEFDFHALR